MTRQYQKFSLLVILLLMPICIEAVTINELPPYTINLKHGEEYKLIFTLKSIGFDGHILIDSNLPIDISPEKITLIKNQITDYNITINAGDLEFGRHEGKIFFVGAGLPEANTKMDIVINYEKENKIAFILSVATISSFILMLLIRHNALKNVEKIYNSY